MSVGKLFQAAESATENARVPSDRLVRGSKRSLRAEERTVVTDHIVRPSYYHGL